MRLRALALLPALVALPMPAADAAQRGRAVVTYSTVAAAGSTRVTTACAGAWIGLGGAYYCDVSPAVTTVDGRSVATYTATGSTYTVSVSMWVWGTDGRSYSCSKSITLPSGHSLAGELTCIV